MPKSIHALIRGLLREGCIDLPPNVVRWAVSLEYRHLTGVIINYLDGKGFRVQGESQHIGSKQVERARSG